MTKQTYLSKIFINEAQFHAATFTYINNNYKELRQFFFHVPNENHHRLLPLGILPGIPDFIFLKPVLWAIELKHGKGKLSESQKQLHKIWQGDGIKVFVCYNAQEVVDALDEIYI